MTPAPKARVVDRARAMDEEQAQVGVAALGDPAEASAQSA
jgi:hypothetical protein